MDSRLEVYEGPDERAVRFFVCRRPFQAVSQVWSNNSEWKLVHSLLSHSGSLEEAIRRLFGPTTEILRWG